MLKYMDFLTVRLYFQHQRGVSPPALNTPVVNLQTTGCTSNSNGGGGNQPSGMTYSNLNSYTNHDFPISSDLSLGSVSSLQQVGIYQLT